MIKTEKQRLYIFPEPGYVYLDANEDFKKYIKYSLGQVEELSEKDIFNIELLEILFKLGYPVNELGTYLYKDLIYEVYNRLDNNENNQKKLKEELKNAFSSIYLYIAREVKELGIKPFHLYIERALKSIDYDDIDINLARKVFDKDETDYGSQAYMIASYKKGLSKLDNKDLNGLKIKRIPNMTTDIVLKD